jgi:subtilisin family serine protease
LVPVEFFMLKVSLNSTTSPRSVMNARSQRASARRFARRRLSVELLEERTLLSIALPAQTLGQIAQDLPAFDPSNPGIVIQFQPGMDGAVAQVQPLVQAEGATIAPSVASGLFEVHGDLSALQRLEPALQKLPYVQYAEPLMTFHTDLTPNDPQFLDGTLWNMNGAFGINAPAAWDRSTGSTKVVIADIDTGINYNHPDLYENVWLNQAEIPASRKVNLVDVNGDGVIDLYDLNYQAPDGSYPNQGPFKITAQNGGHVITAADILRPMDRDASGNDLGTGGWAYPGNTLDGDTAHPNDFIGWNFVANNNNPLDDNGHGSHTAGTIGGIGNNGVGIVGVNWQTEIMPVKAFNANGGGTETAIVASLNYAVAHGAKVSNNSYGGGGISQLEYNAVKNARDNGHLFVCAAGNAGANNDNVDSSPACFTRLTSAGPALINVISVAAIDSSGNLAGFSDYGANSVQLGAPGVSVYSSYGSGYTFLSGTSMATPHVAGAAALLQAEHLDWSDLQIKDRILGTTTPTSSLNGKTTTGGRLNVGAALATGPVVWINPGDGDWSVGANWSTGTPPGPGDDVVINTPHTVTHSSGTDSVHSLSDSAGATLDITGGSLSFSTTFTINGTLLIDGGTLDLGSKTLDGTGSTTVTAGNSWTLVHSTIHTGLDNQGTLETRAGVDLTSAFSNDSGATLRVVADGTGAIGGLVLRLAGSFTNHGLIEMNTTQSNVIAALGLTTGTLTNAADGTIHTLAGAGGGNQLNAPVNNQGTITVDGGFFLNLAANQTAVNSGTIAVSGANMGIGTPDSTAAFTNTGSITIASGQTLTSGANQGHFNNTGGTITGSGTLDLYGSLATFNGDFNTDSLTLLMHFSTYNSTGALIVSSTSTFEVLYTATVNTAVLNHGVVDLSSIVGPNDCILTVSGTLTNAADGTILSDPGTGGSRTLNALVDNEGLITVSATLTISRASAAQINNGTTSLTANLTVTLSGSGASYTNNGTINVGSGTTFTISGGPLTNFSGGTLSGGVYNLAGTFKFDNAAITTNAAGLTLIGPSGTIVNQSNVNALAALSSNTAAGALDFQGGISVNFPSFTNAGSFEVDDTSVVAIAAGYLQNSGTTIVSGGTLRAGTLIDIEGGVAEGNGKLDANVTNGAGQLIVGFTGSPGVLTITGNFTQSSGGDLYIEIGGTNAGTDYGQLSVGGTANLDGTLSVKLINGFTPSSGSNYQVLTAGTVNGSFATLDMDGLLFTPVYDPADVTLVAN